MKGFDNCSQNKILKIMIYIYYCTLVFGKIDIIHFLIKHCFYFLYKNKRIIITFILQCTYKQMKCPLHTNKDNYLLQNINLVHSYES